MPRIKRWFPASHDINSDHELWEMTDTIGDRSLRIWLEFLSIADRNEGVIVPGSDRVSDPCPTAFRHTIAWKAHTSPIKVRQVFDWAVAREWIVLDPLPRLRNYAKYHPSRDANGNPRGTRTQFPLPSFLTNLHTHKNEYSAHKNEHSKGGAISTTEFAEIWNKVFGKKLSAVTLPLTPSRKQKIRSRLKEHQDRDFWKAVFKNIRESSFLNGGSDGSWVCTLDWLVANDKNCMKVFEGNYSNNKNGSAEVEVERMARLKKEMEEEHGKD